MNKADLIREVEKFTNTKKEAAGAVDAVFTAITKALKKGGVTIVGFGTFKVNGQLAQATPDRKGNQNHGEGTQVHGGKALGP
jgi:nucleoid DNA-binding protein